MSMRISMPLAGMDPTSQKQRDERNRLGDDEARAFRMLSEGELFYVDTDLHEDQLGMSRHDHSHLGGVSLEEVNRSMATRNAGGKMLMTKPESIAETEAASRSSSQDSTYSNNSSWRQGEQQRNIAGTAGAVGLPQQAQEQSQHLEPSFITQTRHQPWDYSMLDDALSSAAESRERERSFSEPHLRNCARQLTNHLPPQNPIPESTVQLLQRRASERSERVNDAAHLNPLARSLGCWFGGAKVEDMSRHLTSCTSTKTFNMLDTEVEKDALARMGVIPDSMSGGLEGSGSMTFTMHIAGYRVVSTIFGRHAEYEVRMKGGGRSWSRWQRFTKFKLIVQCVDKDSPAMRAWGRVTKAQPHFRCLHPDYLAQKCNLLEVFLQQVLFEMTSPALLIHFVSDKQIHEGLL